MQRIFKHTDKKEWEEFCATHQLALDIYYQPEFLLLDAEMQKGSYELYTYTEGKNVFVYPSVFSPIPLNGFENYDDMTSPYGYAGPYSNSNDSSFIEKAEQSLISSIRSRNVVCEFVRYHYLYNEHLMFKTDIHNLQERRIVVLFLEKKTDEMFQREFSANAKNIFRKMQRENYLFEFCEDEASIQEFYDMYVKTMDNAKANSFYYFGEEYMKTMMQRLTSKRIKLCRIVKDGITYAMALFLINNDIVTYYLSSRNLLYPKVSANGYLLMNMGIWAAKNGYSVLNFGGGTDSGPENSLLKFKKNFSTKILDFHIGKRIHKKEIYQQLIEKYIQDHGQEEYNPKKHFLQFYKV